MKPNTPIPETKNSVITFKVVARASLKRMLSTPKIIIIGTKKSSFRNSSWRIHLGLFQIITSTSGRRQATKIDSRFQGYGQICTAVVEKKTINIVDMQKTTNAALPHLSQPEYLVPWLEFILHMFAHFPKRMPFVGICSITTDSVYK